MKKAEQGSEQQLNDEEQTEEQQTEGEQEQQTADEGEQQTKESTVEEVVVTIGEESPPPEEDEKQAPEWVRELRKNHRELVRENRELKEKVAATTTTETKPVTVGAKPELDDFNYDTEKFEHEVVAWYDRKREADAKAAEVEAAQKEQQKAWQAKLDGYGKAKAELKVKDFEDAEATVFESLNITQQGIIVQGAENSALVIYALGKNPKKVKELASITDPVKFAFAVAKLETQLKVTNRKAAPPPEKTVSGSAPKSGSVDSTLDRLRAEAEKTGDYTKVTAYKRQQRKAS